MAIKSVFLHLKTDNRVPNLLRTSPHNQFKSLSVLPPLRAGTLRGDQGTPLLPSSGENAAKLSPLSPGDRTPRRAQRGGAPGQLCSSGVGPGTVCVPLAENPGTAGARHGRAHPRQHQPAAPWVKHLFHWDRSGWSSVGIDEPMAGIFYLVSFISLGICDAVTGSRVYPANEGGERGDLSAVWDREATIGG